MDVRQIELFRAVMLHNGINRAAAALGMAQPNISRAIAGLEEDIGFALFNREKQRVAPTDEGVAFFREVQHSFVGLDRLRQAARDIKEFGTGRLRIASLMALSFDFAPRAMRRFITDFPEATISFQARPSSQVWEYTSGGLCEIGYAGPKDGFSGVSSTAFLTLDAVAVLPKGHRLARRQSLTEADFENERFISLALEDPTRHVIDLAFAARNVKRNLVAESQSSSVLCAMVANGIGIAITNPLMFLERRYKNILFKPLEFPIKIAIILLTPSYRQPSRLAVGFIQAMEDEKTVTLDSLRESGIAD
ncbi:LysR substrate-binding domain-containing protein [Paraburkholderia sp. BL9I2N2]|uniref:LysR substrate-binding domain-containing protein n=1 Tax=Paraburkholderia sp. BL9I2N2 TaxID=1938809 RepID=UPI0010519A41|nr:LysR substrate-binding domain-containing protein [Paraburkholderia sp. BL9I2N2]TCK94642.1 DNA-binding transcriptional LysR family regulator [Paraburkholderia sp. BL9I2N2]